MAKLHKGRATSAKVDQYCKFEFLVVGIIGLDYEAGEWLGSRAREQNTLLFG
jgi:hypothetical protein